MADVAALSICRILGIIDVGIRARTSLIKAEPGLGPGLVSLRRSQTRARTRLIKGGARLMTVITESGPY